MCSHTSYDVQLSHSALSGLAMHSILQDKEEMAKQDFQDTMNLQHRVDSVNFIDILSKIKGVLNAISQFKNFIRRQTGQKVHFFQKAIQIATDYTKHDLDLIMDQIKKHNVVYSTYMKHERDGMVKIFEKFANSVEQFATSFKLEHPCVDGKPIKSLQARKKTLDKDFRGIKHMTDMYQKLYNLSWNHNGSYSDTSVFTLFPQYAHAGFHWAEGKNIPIKAVIDEMAINDCNEFWVDFDNFKNKFTNITKLFNTYIYTYSPRGINNKCNKDENLAELTTTGGSGSESSIGSVTESDSGSGLGDTSSIGYTAHTGYISYTPSSNRGDSDDVSLGYWSSEGYITSTTSNLYSQNATNTTTDNNSGDTLFSSSRNSDDLSSGDLANEGYITSTISTLYSQNANNRTTDSNSGDTLSSNSGDSDDVTSGDLANEEYMTSTIFSVYSQNATNPTADNNSGDTLFSISGDSDDVTSVDLANEAYITSTIPSVNSQNAANTTADNKNNSGDLASEEYITSAMSTHDSQHVTYTSNSDSATAYSNTPNTESIKTCDNPYDDDFWYNLLLDFPDLFSIYQRTSSEIYFSLSPKLDQFSLTCQNSLATVNVCFTDYGNFLQQTLKDFEEIKQKSHSLDTYSFNITYLEDFDKIESIAETYRMYIANESSKLDLANKLLAESAESTSLLRSLNDLILVYSQRFEQETIASTRSQLRKIKESLVHNYDIMIEKFLALAEYMNDTIKGDEVEDFHILRKPLPTVKDSEYVNYSRTQAQVKRDIENKPIIFFKEKGKNLVKTAMEGFFDELFSELEELHKQFVEVKGVFISAVNDLKETLQTHQSELTIGPAFVR